MEERKQFTFYSSFLDAILRIKKPAERCAAYDAICRYALRGELPDLDKLPDAAAIAFDLTRPNLDASRRKAISGKAGGKSKQTGSKPEANCKQEETAREKEREEEKEIEKEYECTTPSTPLGEVMSFFLDRINATPSPDCLDYLRQYTEALSAPVVLHALQIALDEKKTGFAYIKAILARYEREGLRTLEAVKAQEQAREAQTAKQPGRMSKSPMLQHYERPPINMDEMRKIIDKI